MRIFPKGNWSHGDTCLACKTAKEGQVTLIGVIGTEDGGNMQALQVHVDCLELYYYPKVNAIAQKLPELENNDEQQP